jgi:hypothetical protein
MLRSLSTYVLSHPDVVWSRPQKLKEKSDILPLFKFRIGVTHMPKLIGILIAVFSLAFAAAGQEVFTGKAVTSYDAAKGETTIEMRNIPLAADNGGKYKNFNVSTSFKGKDLTSRPVDVLFIVQVVNAKGHHYPDQNDVALISDGHEFGKIVLLNLDQRQYPETTDILETLGTRMPIALYQKLTRAKQPVTFKIGETSFTIAKANLSNLADFEKAITP